MKNELIRGGFFNDMFSSFDRFVDTYDGIFESRDYSIRHLTDNEKHRIEIEMPGVDEKNIDIKVIDNRLTIKWTDRYEKKQNKSIGIFNYDPSNVKATLNKGILEIIIPKKEEKKAKAIEIKVNA